MQWTYCHQIHVYQFILIWIRLTPLPSSLPYRHILITHPTSHTSNQFHTSSNPVTISFSCYPRTKLQFTSLFSSSPTRPDNNTLRISRANCRVQTSNYFMNLTIDYKLVRCDYTYYRPMCHPVDDRANYQLQSSTSPNRGHVVVCRRSR